MGSLSVQAQKTEKLFNGKDLSNWEFLVDKNSVPAEQVYSVKDGMIQIAGQPFGYMYTKQKYSNYKLHVEWRWPDGKEANSGIFLLIEDLKNPFPNGVECQLHAGDAGDFVLLGGSDLAEFQNKPGQPRPAFPVPLAHSQAQSGKQRRRNGSCIPRFTAGRSLGIFRPRQRNARSQKPAALVRRTNQKRGSHRPVYGQRRILASKRTAAAAGAYGGTQ